MISSVLIALVHSSSGSEVFIINHGNPNQERLLEDVEYDEFGALTFNKDKPHYQSGFPKEHSVCHR